MTIQVLKTCSGICPVLGISVSRFRHYCRRHAFAIRVGVVVAAFLLVAGWQWIVVAVPAGYVAVKYYRFGNGTDVQQAYEEGSHLKWPWDKMHLYQVRLQQVSRDFEVLTHDGLAVTVNIACRFRLRAPAVGWLHRNIGPDYAETLIVPALGSYARLIISRNSTDELYSDRRAVIQEEIKRAVANDLAQRTEQREPPSR